MFCFSLLFILIELMTGSPELPPTAPPKLTDYPAVIMAYDPALGGTNCDGDCSTIATGPLTQDMYGTVAACHQDLLGRSITLPSIGTFDCLDTGGAIRVAYNEYFEREVLYFDVMYDLVNNDRPRWAGMLLEDWELD